jgi:hypothetical protein
MRLNLPIRVDGCDLSGVALGRARSLSGRHEAGCDFFALDAVRNELPPGYDATVSSLFLHHLTVDDVRALLRKLAGSVRLVVISDLVRSGPAWAATWLGTRVLSRSPVVHCDGPRSVEAAFTTAEMRRLLDATGLETARVERVWPLRMRVTWKAVAAEADA